MGLVTQPISQCKIGCDAQADCVAFTFNNMNGFTCMFFQGYNAATLGPCGTAQEMSGAPFNWITSCGLGQPFQADCPQTSESWYKSQAVCPTVSPTETPCAVSAPTGGTLGTCSASLSSGSSCQPTCNGGFWIVGTTTSCLRGTLTAAQCIGVTSSAPPNTPSSWRSSLTIAGAGFSGYNDRNIYYGYQDATPSVRLETSRSCLTSSWTSNTALTCLPQALLNGQTQLVAATVAATVGTAMSRLFSYDGMASTRAARALTRAYRVIYACAVRPQWIRMQRRL